MTSSEFEKTDRHFSNVLLISGPSGAGKSTFINSMVEGRLAPELMSLIPEDAVRWPTVLEKDMRKGRVAPDSTASRGDADVSVIFHYDTFFVHRIGSPDYSRDPISSHLLHAPNLTIVNIKPEPGQLRAQYDRRHDDKLTQSGHFRNLWRETGVRWFKRLRYRFLGVGWPYTRDLYNRAGTIEECYRSWETFLACLIGARQATRLVEVIPDGDESHSDQFKLLNAQELTPDTSFRPYDFEPPLLLKTRSHGSATADELVWSHLHPVPRGAKNIPATWPSGAA